MFGKKDEIAQLEEELRAARAREAELVTKLREERTATEAEKPEPGKRVALEGQPLHLNLEPASATRLTQRLAFLRSLYLKKKKPRWSEADLQHIDAKIKLIRMQLAGQGIDVPASAAGIEAVIEQLKKDSRPSAAEGAAR